MAVKVSSILPGVALALALLLTGSASSQQAPDAGSDAEAPPSSPDKPPMPFKPDPGTPDAAAPDVWIFSGELQGSHETFSGTLVAGKEDVQFELKLAGGATCDGSTFKGDVGLVRLEEVTCSDDRTMRALFVPQGGKELKVFGHVGEERFITSAHLLGTEAVPEKKQTTEPTAPAMRAPGSGDTPPSPPAGPAQ